VVISAGGRIASPVIPGAGAVFGLGRSSTASAA